MKKLITVNEETLLEKIFKFYNNPSSKEIGAIVLPCDPEGYMRWYITRIKCGMKKFLDDQPLLKEIVSRSSGNISWEDIKKNVENIPSGLGTWLRFVPGLLDSDDILVNQYNIQPYTFKDIEEVTELMVTLLFEAIENPLYSGPFRKNEDLDEYQCCYYTITEEELQKDIEKFREGNNKYYTNIDPLDFPFDK